VSEVWLTHPKLTPAHDMKVLRSTIGQWAGSGWQVREDQSDPAPVQEQSADPRELVDEPVVEDVPDPVDEPVAEQTPAARTSSRSTTRKGEV
jgi:hypothetical protein